jgi:hypothetical protein
VVKLSDVGPWLCRPALRSRGSRRMIPGRVARFLLRRYIHELPIMTPASTPARDVELFVRIGPRDMDIAPLAVASVRRHLAHPIGRFVVATPHAILTDVRMRLPDAEMIADEDILAEPIRERIAAMAPSRRIGWVTQQFLSLTYVARHAQQSCLVWDADTFMVRPRTVVRGTTAALAVSAEHHAPYFDLIRRLLPDLPLPEWSSTITHAMLMEPALLNELLGEIERHGGGRVWWDVILSQIDRREASCLSEYELYGQWIKARHPNRVELVPFRNVARPRKDHSDAVLDRLADDGFDSVSFHYYVPSSRWRWRR